MTALLLSVIVIIGGKKLRLFHRPQQVHLYRVCALIVLIAAFGKRERDAE